MSDLYQVDGAHHFKHPHQVMLNDKDFYPDFEKDLEKFQNLVEKLVKNGESKTFIHYGDGDYSFLAMLGHGSAAPGKRALSKQYNQIDMKPFREGFVKNDYLCVEKFEPHNLSYFKKVYPYHQPDFPTEFLYALLANKWFFKKFKGKIGLIGAKEKLQLVEKLMEHKEYQEYLGLDSFTDYIYIPQKFACDDLQGTISMVADQIKNSSASIFLFGVGHVKSGLIHELRDVKKAVYIDVGAGIDAIAGIIDPYRPYMYGWTNYRLSSFDYSVIDYLQYKPNGKEVIL